VAYNPSIDPFIYLIQAERPTNTQHKTSTKTEERQKAIKR